MRGGGVEYTEDSTTRLKTSELRRNHHNFNLKNNRLPPSFLQLFNTIRINRS